MSVFGGIYAFELLMVDAGASMESKHFMILWVQHIDTPFAALDCVVMSL